MERLLEFSNGNDTDLGNANYSQADLYKGLEEEEAESQMSGWLSRGPTWGKDLRPHLLSTAMPYIKP